jgi:hypothetical protein
MSILPSNFGAVFQKKAEQVRDEMREQIPSVEKLFETVQSQDRLDLSNAGMDQG